jgi:hypothetical protein
MGEQNLQTTSEIAGVDLSAKQYRFVKLQSTGKVTVPSAGGHITGVNQDKPVLDEVCAVAVGGVSFAQAGGTIAAGDLVTPGTDGKAVVAGTGDAVAGEAKQAAVLDDLFTIIVKPQHSV